MEQINTLKTVDEEGIFEERTRNLERLLDEAKQEYGHRLEIVDKVVDVTDCFLYQYPINFELIMLSKYFKLKLLRTLNNPL